MATLGPATETEEKIRKLIEGGVNIFRFNLKYSPASWHIDKIKRIRKIAKGLHKSVGIVVDMPRSDFSLTDLDWDYLALSYLKNSREIINLKTRLKKYKRAIRIIAKIENREAMMDLDNIVDVSEAIMVARGDLGIETPIRELAYFQKKIIDVCRQKGKPVIVATEMLYSMINNKTPTRAEATDVSNAVFDGTDALMLSEETAIGKYPVEAVKTMDEIASFCEDTGELRKIVLKPKLAAEYLFESAARITESSAIIKAIIVFTKSGQSAKLISRYRLTVPIVAISDEEGLLRELNLSFGVIPYFKKFQKGTYHSEDPVFKDILDLGIVKAKDTVIVIHGNNWLESGSSNNLSLKTF